MIIGSNNTLYNIIIEMIIKDIITGKTKPGDKIASVREQAKSNKINPQTVQKAYNILIDENIIIAKIGSGNFVTDDINIINDMKSKYIDNEIDKMVNTIQKYKIDTDIIIDKIKELNE